MKIKAAVTHAPGAPFQIEEVELAAPQKHEILVKITACGVCHTDDAARQQVIPVPLPAVLGHEGCGVVEAVGPEVTEFQPGDKVGISFGYCGRCHNCMTAHQHACENFNAINFGGVQPDGTSRLSALDGTPLATFSASPRLRLMWSSTKPARSRCSTTISTLRSSGRWDAASRPVQALCSTACGRSSARP